MGFLIIYVGLVCLIVIWLLSVFMGYASFPVFPARR